jgi:hypothetical protein
LREAFDPTDQLSLGASALVIATLSALSWADVIAIARALIALVS